MKIIEITGQPSVYDDTPDFQILWDFFERFDGDVIDKDQLSEINDFYMTLDAGSFAEKYTVELIDKLKDDWVPLVECGEF